MDDKLYYGYCYECDLQTELCDDADGLDHNCSCGRPYTIKSIYGGNTAKCKVCGKSTSFLDPRPEGFIDCMHCGFEIDLHYYKD